MEYWFSSDLHAWHKSVMNFCPTTRRGKDAEEMTYLMLDKFHEYVGTDDVLILLGDVSFGGRTKVEDFISRLPGNKMLVLGNHDYIIKRRDDLRAYFELGVHEAKRLTIGDHKFTMSHEPKAEWVDCHKGVIHLHGHLHGNKTNVQWQQRYRIMDVGIDARPDDEMRPWHLDEVVHIACEGREIMSHHDGVEECT